MFTEEDGSTIGYMCKTSFEYELGAASGGNTIYPSIEDMKRNHDCWESCGIVEVKVFYNQTIVEETDHD
jgi:hypothetical protein